MARLIKNVTTTYIPGDPGNPGTPATIAQPGYWTSEPQTTCAAIQTLVTPDYNPLTGQGGLPIYYVVGYECTTVDVPVYHPPVAGSDGVPYAAPTPAQIIVSLNVGWNSYASSIGKLEAGKFLRYTIKPGTTGAFLAIGYAGMEGQPIGAFTHGLMADISTVRALENGVAGTVLGAPSTDLRIARLASGHIVYAVGSVYAISAAPAYLPSEDLYVYGLLYSGYDEVSTAEFVADELVKESAAMISGTGSLSADVEQFVEASISGVGSLVASPFPSATLSGVGSLAATVEQASEASIPGVGTVWAYAEVSYPLTATISGTGSIVASPFPTATLSGVGTITARTEISAVVNGRGRLTAEAYRGQLTEAALVGIGKLFATAEVGGRGYAELPVFVGLGGDTDYAQGYGTLPLFASGPTNGESDFVPEPINRGYGNLPFIVGAAFATEISIGTGSGDLPLFVGVAGDYDYGLGRGDLPMFVGAGYGGFVPDDMLVLMSSVLGTMPLTQQIDLVLILNSDGGLTSSLTLTREQAMALLSSLQHSSSFSMLGTYGLTMLSGLHGLSLESLTVGSRADLYDNGAVWVVNLDTNASVQYERYGFNSFFHRGSEYYGVANDGIYKLSGDTDAGDPIDALVEFARTNLGKTQAKRLSAVYLAASGNTLVLKVVTPGRTNLYTARWGGADMRNQRVAPGKGLQSAYWQFSVLNQNGEDFDLGGLEFLPIVTQRRV